MFCNRSGNAVKELDCNIVGRIEFSENNELEACIDTLHNPGVSWCDRPLEHPENYFKSIDAALAALKFKSVGGRAAIRKLPCNKCVSIIQSLLTKGNMR